MARLFVGIWPPASVLDQLDGLPRVERAGVRWTTREQWHVTLRFLGEADPDPVVDALSSLASPRCEAVLGPRVGRLGRGILMLPVAGLDHLAADVHACTAAASASASAGRAAAASGAADPSGFLGHLTLARMKGSPACGLTDAVVRARWPVEEIVLVRSRTLATGAVYDTLTTVPLD